MYLAPLNYDRFFKKVFSNKDIAKAFLEDFLEVEIQTIEPLGNKHRITDDATIVEFDYRCKVDDHYIIIDMQQWYKSDVIQRFFIYHSLNSVLQLQDLPIKKANAPKVKNQNPTKSYHELEPVITIIWMVDDKLGSSEDILSYAMQPEDTIHFLLNDELWKEENRKSLLDERIKIVKTLKNKVKEIDFIQKNRLIFAFQQNIIKSKKLKKYVRWFQFAQTTRDENNKKEDFTTFKNDKDFKQVYPLIEQRIVRKTLAPDEINYLHSESENQKMYRRYEEGLVKVVKHELEHTKEVNAQLTKSLEDRDRALEDRDRALEDRDRALEDRDRALEDKDALIAEMQRKLETLQKKK